MKTKNIQFEEHNYTLKSMGFFKANRLLFKCIGPVTPLLKGMDKDNKDKESLVSQILPLLKVELVEEIIKGILENTQRDGEPMDLEELDYGLAVDLVKEAITLNYSSLGKLLAKLKGMIPADKLEELEQLSQ